MAAMPAFWASAEVLNVVSLPASWITPASGAWIPVMILISVDLPAPFSSRVGSAEAAVDVEDVAGGLGRSMGREESDRLCYVLGVDVDVKRRPLAIEGRQVFLGDAVGARALRLPLRRPDPGALDDCVRVHGVNADAVRTALLCEAARKVERRGLR